LGLLLLALSACNDDAGKADAEAGEPEDYGPVRGDLEITSIEISQSVVQPIYAAGEVVNPATYGVPLVPGRDMWVRALWDPPLEWTPRPLIARLHLEYPDGTEVVIEDNETQAGTPPFVVGKSTATDLQSSFYWKLDAEDVVPDLRYSVTVVEPEPMPDIPASTGKTRWPRESNTALPIQAAPANLNLYLVGVRYNTPECTTDTSVLPADELEAIRAGFEAWSAVATNTVSIDTSLSVDIDQPTNVLALLEVVGPIRAQYADIVDAYFLILLDDCSAVPDGILGVAPVNSDPPVQGEAAMRYGAGLWNPNDVRESVNTALHEIGHSQGALHSPCGGADGPDPAYPWPNASIGVFGLELPTALFYDPASYADFMSYCRPYWVSDYRFRKNYGVLSQLTAWAGAGAPAVGPNRTMLAGIVQADGQTRFWVYDNPLPPPVHAGALQLEVRTDGGALALPTDVRPLPDVPGASLVQVVLPEHVDTLDIRGIDVHGALELSLAAPRINDRRNPVVVRARE
jgi:hypothetical protein